MLHPQPKIVLVMYMYSSHPCESILPSYVEPVETNLVQRDQYTTHLDTISSLYTVLKTCKLIWNHVHLFVGWGSHSCNSCQLQCYPKYIVQGEPSCWSRGARKYCIVVWSTGWRGWVCLPWLHIHHSALVWRRLVASRVWSVHSAGPD